MVVISAKISEELLDDIEYLRIALDIPTRQEFIERALRLFIFSCRVRCTDSENDG